MQSELQLTFTVIMLYHNFNGIHVRTMGSAASGSWGNYCVCVCVCGGGADICASQLFFK
jgi:hypothetical protein